MVKYAAVAHIRWELPFSFRLPPHVFICWEPEEGSALFDPKPAVGALHWTRTCQFLNAKDVFVDVGLTQNDHVYPKHDYKITCVKSGKELPIIQLHSGLSGGFSEARPFTIANIFLCLKDLAGHSKPEVFKRAETALNNIINLYRFFTQDPSSRSLCLARDSYYTTISVAPIPSEWPELPAKEVFQRLGELQFGSTLGQAEDRSHNIGLGGGDDLIAGEVLPQDILQLFFQWITSNIQLEFFHQLLLSAIRRLKTREFALSVVDAQSAFESNVSIILIEALKARGDSAASITTNLEYGGKYHLLNQRLTELDNIARLHAVSVGRTYQPFIGSIAERKWRNDLYNLRNQIVHQGIREISFDQAKSAIVAGMRAVCAIQTLSPTFNRQLMWTDNALTLDHIRDTPGHLFRMFES